MFYSFGYRSRSPGFVDHFFFIRRLNRFSKVKQSLSCIFSTVKQYIFYPLQKFFINIGVHLEHGRIDNSHVHSMLDRMVEERSVHGLTYRIVSSEGKRHVTDPTTYFRTRKVLLDPACCIKKVNCIFPVFLHAGCYRENIGIKNDVLVIELHLIHQNPVAPLTDLDASLVGIGLSILIKRHDHYCSTKFLDSFGLVDKFFFPIFQRNRIHDSFALNALKASKDDAPLGAINHNRNSADFWFRGNQIKKAHHGEFPIKHPLVHTHVQYLRTTSNLIQGNIQGIVVLSI